MERTGSGHDSSNDGDEDRRSRFQGTATGTENGAAPLRERAASQPPRSSDTSFVSSPPTQHFVPSNVGGPWSNNNSSNSSANSRMLSPNRGQPIPIRSSSFSAHPQNHFSSTMRDRAFPSTFEDDESEALSDTYDERYVPPSLARGRNYNQDISRSRSQSLATGRPGPVGSPYTGSSAMQSWNESYLSHTNPLNIPSGGQRYGEIKPPGQSRYGSLGTMGRSPSTSSPTGGSLSGNGYHGSSRNQQTDISNMSPFVRDVGQILLDDGSAFRELWAGMNPPRDENGGGGSGTTSRRHSVSVVQPRRGNIVGFNAPGADNTEEAPRPSFQPAYGGRGSGLLLSDDDLASDLGLLNINPNEPPPPSSQHPPSQPSSLPIYAPLSRSPPSRDLMSNYQSINLAIPGGNNNYSRQPIGTPSDGGDYSAGGNTPPRGLYEDHHAQNQYSTTRAPQQHQHQQPEPTARFIPGHGIQYGHPQQHFQQQQHHQQLQHQQQQHQQQQQHHAMNNNTQYVRARAPSYSGNLQSPISPGTRPINPQQPPYYPQTQRRLSDAQHQQPPTPTSAHPSGSGSSVQGANLADLGKGVPLHSVPSSWPLFIVEFKAGRTDLFYLTDLSQDIRIGDLVIVEADRGKDLGKVVNDSITLAEVEAFQRVQAERGFGGGGSGGGGGDDGVPTSPGGGAGGGGTGKKEINPKMIYKRAGPQELQLLATKTEDEVKALQLCQSKVRAKKLPMEVIDAEYQWDRRKLTFYFVAEKRIDFRELVRELFRLYKTRIWMASLQGGGGFEQ
ncbi:hypothetical protein CVT25_007611 [Psilocybe cyanescens]|uniref:PSP1 C-terminal domain-containing protein n=1 Tax=Psilocybe cyanescens TaxID=93625 RepID=A0A409X1C7_PSICY|nr:hypothetical protein CVT25_007611 [Psilocybe cyanescens]